jgi:CRP/FNR family transcriptional regulator
LQRNLHTLLASEISRGQNQFLVPGSMRADERVDLFLLDLAARYRGRGYSSVEFELRMSREEIGSFLSLALETVSRILSGFQAQALIQVQGRRMRLLDAAALRQIVGQVA